MSEIKSYVNNKGKVVVIAEMVDAYLLNSYVYYKKRMALVKQTFINEYDLQLAEMVKALKAEIDKRKLL